MKTLLIVESPAKSKTIEKLLGPNYIVLASFGHIRDLEKDKGTDNMGIEIENNFRPIYKKMKEKAKQIKIIEDKIKDVDRVFLASDEDREGEAIAWHCAVVFKLNINEKNRICFHEITKTALENAVSNPRTIDMNMVNSQQARRILDRLVGFQISPLLCVHIGPKLSAGRVQSAALKILVEQEKEINKFTEKKYYKTIGNFEKNLNGNLNVNFENNEEVQQFLEDCKTSQFKITKIEINNLERRPPPPYTTSTIQQDIGSRFSIGAKIIMSILQKLYEHGHITYHRTDSTNLSEHIQGEIKEYVINKYGKKYSHLRNYKSKIKCAQEAHEAIRPTHINIENIPENDFSDIEQKVYNIIWKRTVACQMSASISELYTINITISNRKELFISKAEKLLFDGYKKVYDDTIKKEDNDDDDTDIKLPDNFIADNIKEGEFIQYTKIISNEKYQIPPLRYTEATLIKKMEKIGIGRPSTYSNIIEILLERKYTEKKDIKGKKVEVVNFILEKNNIKNKKDNITTGGEKKKLIPTQLGIKTIQFLEQHFTNILDTNFTASMEEKLDHIANNVIEWTQVLDDFYNDLKPCVNQLKEQKISKNENKNFLGLNSDGKPIYAYLAKYGPVFQIGEGLKKNISYIPLEPNMNVDTVTLQDFNNMIKFPLLLGQYEQKDLFLKKGQYGLYLTHNDINYSLTDEYDKNITLNEAINIIEIKNKPINNGIDNDNDAPKKTSTLIKKVNDYLIKDGPYGPYIHFKQKFYSIPKEYNPSELTKIECDNIIKLPKKVFNKKK
jgi:DNA topoisomerase-1